MRVLLSTYDSRGGVEPLVGLAVRLRQLGAAQDVQAPATESRSAAFRTDLTFQTCARAAAVAGMIRTDRATVAARLLVDAVSRERPPVSA